MAFPRRPEQRNFSNAKPAVSEVKHQPVLSITLTKSRYKPAGEPVFWNASIPRMPYSLILFINDFIINDLYLNHVLIDVIHAFSTFSTTAT